MVMDMTPVVKQYRPKFKAAKMFGIPIMDLSMDELRACVCVLGEQLVERNKRDGIEPQEKEKK